MSYSQKITEDVRLRTLQQLVKAPQYTLPAAALRASLVEYGHELSADRMTTELAWLEEQGLLIQRPVGATSIAVLTPRGEDVAAGRSQQPGVARPRPGE